MARQVNEFTDEVAEWVVEALIELKGLRGWAWDGKDFENYRTVLEDLDENADNY